MRVALPLPAHLTWDEYLALEDGSEVRHELVGGVAFVMTGGSQRHSLLAGAIYRALAPAALAAGCRPHIHVMRLKISDSAAYYPDIMIGCGPVVDPLCELAPVFLAEVSSPSSVVTDRREKLGAYLAIPSLLAYLVFDQHQPVVDVHERVNGVWRAWGAGPGERISVPHPAVTLDLGEIYGGLPDLGD